MEFSEYIKNFPVFYANACANTCKLFPSVRKEQVFGGSFLHLFLISVVFSSWNLMACPKILLTAKTKRIWNFANSELKYTILLNHPWNAIGEAPHTRTKVVLWLFLLLLGKKPQNLGMRVSSFIYHGSENQKVEVLSCRCLDVKKLLINLSYFPNQLKILEFGKK